MLSLERLIEYIEGVKEDNKSDEVKEVEFAVLKSGEMESLQHVPDKLNELLDPHHNNMFRYGIRSTTRKRNIIHNISMINSILSCVKNDFINTLEDQKQLYIDNFIDTIIEDYIKRKHEPIYWKDGYGIESMKITKTNIMKSMKTYQNDPSVLQLISTYLCVNIYILNVSSQSINVVYSGKKLNQYCMSIIISTIDNYYEPVFYQEHKLLPYDNELIQQLLSYHKNNIKRMIPYKEKTLYKQVEFGPEDLNKYISEIEETDDDKTKSNNEYTEINDTHDEDDNEGEFDDGLTVTENELDSPKSDKRAAGLFYKKNTKSPETVPISLKLKLAELQKIAKKHKINIKAGHSKNGKVKFKTKAKLYDEIVEAIGL